MKSTITSHCVKISLIAVDDDTLLNAYRCMTLLIIRGGLAEILCKPKILPLKSSVLEQLQKMDQANEVNNTASHH